MHKFPKTYFKRQTTTKEHFPETGLGGLNHLAHLFSAPLQLSIDSCWVGSYYCPMLQFSATIHDAISTESTLFIRQNQLVYYFTGRYTTLFDNSHSSSEKTGLGMGELGKVWGLEKQNQEEH